MPATRSAAIAPPASVQPRGGGPVVAQADPLAPKVSNVPGGLPAPWQQGRTLEQRSDPVPARPAAAVATSPTGGGGGPLTAPDDATSIDAGNAAGGFGATGGVTEPDVAPAAIAAPVSAPAAVAPASLRAFVPLFRRRDGSHRRPLDALDLHLRIGVHRGADQAEDLVRLHGMLPEQLPCGADALHFQGVGAAVAIARQAGLELARDVADGCADGRRLAG